MEERFELFLENLIFSIVRTYSAAIFCIVVYGSFATGKARAGSDLDMLIHLKEGCRKKKSQALTRCYSNLKANMTWR